ncbi:hypothetical protein [Geomonas subterranea]|uniref:hypothetical protein n=1 Tax=Geomonas subterranea TaxID=2847989 RepID=UPI001CD7F48F|nr:hypothetical protein [Geomonas fuzhouensis]
MSKKDQEMKDMLANSAVNFGLLQPTVKPGGAPAEPPAVVPAPAIEPKQEVKAPPEKKAKEPNRAPKSQPGQKPVSKEVQGGKQAPPADPENPFGYAIGPTWPLVGYAKPFLIPMPENQARAGAALSIRIPLELNLTMEAHLARLGVKNLSEWIRHALERQLSVEQEFLAKK